MSQHNVNDGHAAYATMSELTDKANRFMGDFDANAAKENLAETSKAHISQNQMTTRTSEDSPWWTHALEFCNASRLADKALGLAMEAQFILDEAQGEGELHDRACCHVADVLKNARYLGHLLDQIAEIYNKNH